ncbi:phosphatidylinositol 4,5-bisphosphate 3-kinase catalytic subunit gamma isoform isoform X3 [Pangasianodon hypophthalmus]|uniref:phosphatidylinositol 4,5-bisphosphate 3-kinase catalytic subunit gamma isoform isoform X3 n=1 Tax=Pangasianodon hypophthalmus TaxID=310915 RepID=UPI002307B59C|nr:phosphatidylinositol 4,5-bisphosphate 3-kinase catalytic subunit gamma isoform isoform X3 [Pangasianodon hypophthalmus]
MYVYHKIYHEDIISGGMAMKWQQRVSTSKITSEHLHCAEHSLLFMCELPTKEGPQVAREQEAVEVKLPAQCTVEQLRLVLCMRVQETRKFQDPFGLLDPEKYSLLYTKGEDQYEIYDDCQVLKTLDAPWFQNNEGYQTVQITVLAKQDNPEERMEYQQILNELIGYDFDCAAGNRLSELSFTRRKFATPRKEELKKRDPLAYATEPWTTSAPIPKDQQDQLKRKLPVTVNYNDISIHVKADLFNTPSDLLMVLWESMLSKDQCFLKWSANHVLKVCGREEFLCGDFQLSDFLWVRHCLKNVKELHLNVVAIASLPDDAVRKEYWPQVDSLTGLSSSHEEISFAGKEMEEIVMISLWDCERNLRVKLLGIDIPELPSKIPQHIYVEASIIYGSKVVSSVCSLSKEFAEEVLWNTWLEFDIPLKDIPRGAKLGFTINASSMDTAPTRESKSSYPGYKVPDYQKGKGKVLYFVNLQLIDHRSLLSQGSHTLHMWSFPEQEEEAFTYEADKLSTATNPDVAKSMAITFLLDRYSFSVVLPHSRVSSEIMPSTVISTSTNPSSPLHVTGSSQSLPGHMSLQANSLDKHCLKRFREVSVRYASNLPQFLRTVDWLDPSAVQDVHWLLSHWEPDDLELPVALELLSVDYTDEKVRRLAVQRLEMMSNEEVLRYLLQLVQTLKVEPYHDSYLARFLIQRALRSKRVGHFFFWYLRSEVAGCPFFRQRMAVILEAYLLGCGEAMLTSLQHQVQVVKILHEVAIRVKTLYPEKSTLSTLAAQKLQEILQEYSFPPEFQVPFDPRVRAGAILLKECKVMASKKKPLWLEFSHVESEAAAGCPVGIIFKQGDDLRQDMLIIQTLMVMDSIWQENCLDLNLMPYGCISTGYQIGMIEIVRDAVTIAAIQRIQGGTTGAFKNNALFEWLKGMCPLQEKHYQAMEKFVTSCAGYCVATYVLGIGDRHNDNIMITNQGNLFHIDFGHILGNTKSFLGVSRERVPFVLTPDFLYVMGRVNKHSSLYFQRFKDTCIQAYLSLRNQSRLLVTLFSLMLLTGIPELSTAQDMRYLRNALQEDQNEEEARQHFLQQIALCEQKGWTVQANWWIHLMAGIK